MSFWEVLWLILVSFAFIAYLLLLFYIIGDLFRDRETSGWVKAVWIVFLIFLPLITSLIYLIVRGGGMQERSAAEAKQWQAAEQDYIRKTAGTNPAAQIADAKQLLADGTITQAEFEQLKAKALS
ncbi:SHOCT domain-containing protein [Nocardia otitidiscaviarum]|uniref:SHOCT domain-containing protein n=1 Tax=Nocardia otitidiscaviarum TaxID=1823 RepID=UPI0004A7295C|nr:SHOCT domain-containing protein [Nocardia otitidiscaviarum]MBF6136836.1 SHOCT domain-containing protein [Nocardia otitidiscaviarum]MBF6485039.1 SHOCT domain-containing protein [Nocardia otitidiscaviarum]